MYRRTNKYTDKVNVYATSEYRKNKGKRSVHRKFSLVFGGLLISSTLIGCANLELNQPTTHESNELQIVNKEVQPKNEKVKDVYEEKQALLEDLEILLKLVEDNGLNIGVLEKIQLSLLDIEEAVNSIETSNNSRVIDNDSLLKTLLKAEKTIDYQINQNIGSSGEVIEQSNKSLETIGKIKLKILKPEVVADTLPNTDRVEKDTPKENELEDSNTKDVEIPESNIEPDSGVKQLEKEQKSVEENKVHVENIKPDANQGKVVVNTKQSTKTKQTEKKSNSETLPSKEKQIEGREKGDKEKIQEKAKSENPANKEQNSIEKNNVITSKYGSHTYGSKNAMEYEAVMKVVNDALKDVDNVVLGGRNSEYYYEYLEGARWDGDKQNRTERNRGLFSAEQTLGRMVDAGIDSKEIIKAYKVYMIAADLFGGKAIKDTVSLNAYDNLFNNVTDCYADAHVLSAVFDSMGYNTMIVGNATHADMIFELGGKWWLPSGGSFGVSDLSLMSEDKGSIIYVQSTY